MQKSKQKRGEDFKQGRFALSDQPEFNEEDPEDAFAGISPGQAAVLGRRKDQSRFFPGFSSPNSLESSVLAGLVTVKAGSFGNFRKT